MEFTKEELKLIISHCDRIEEEFGRTMKEEDRLTSYQIARKINVILGEETVYLGLMESNMSDLLIKLKNNK